MRTEPSLARSLDWRLRRASQRLRKLPDFIVIGAQRSGTTSLFHHMEDHPEIEGAYRKEVHYFDLHHTRGEGWYRAHFPIGENRVTGESTPQYLVYPPVPARVAALVPDVKLVLLLRNPADRAHSAWRLRVMEGRESRDFEEAWEATEDLEGDGSPRALNRLRFAYRQTGEYVDHIERWLAHFPRSRLHLIVSEELFGSPGVILDGLWHFLGVRPWESAFRAMNQAEPAGIDPAVRRRLTSYYAPFNRRLSELTGLDLPWD